VGRARTGFLDVLARMGADIEVVPGPGESSATADIRVRHSRLRSTDVGGAEVATLLDEIPVLAVAAAMADGVTSFRDASELVVKETNRAATRAAELGALGARVEPLADGLVVPGSGGRPLAGATVCSHGDHRVAMAMAVAALAAEGRTRIEGWDAVATSYPGFEGDLRACLS
jgi:3-phosphoshikimate 1-carboxyvinyltransferase